MVGTEYTPVEWLSVYNNMSIYVVCINCKEILREHTTHGNCLFSPTLFVGLHHIKCGEYVTKHYVNLIYCSCGEIVNL